MATLGTFTAGQVLTAAELNAIGTWTDFTPTWASGLTVGNGTVEAKYTTINDITIVYVDVTFGSTSSIGGDVRMELPVETAANTFTAPAFLQGNAYDASAAGYSKLMGTGFNFDNVRIRASNTALGYVTSTALSSTVPFTWATGDHLTFTTYYRSA